MKKHIVLSIILTLSLTGCSYESTDSKSTKISNEDGGMNIAISKNSNTAVVGENNEPLLKTGTELSVASDGTLANTKVNADMDINGINSITDLKEYVNNIVNNQVVPMTETTKEDAKKLLAESLVISQGLLDKAKVGLVEAGESTTGYVKNWFAETWEESKARTAAKNNSAITE